MMEYIIYLAAGNSRRFGSNKLLYYYEGRRLFEYGLDAVLTACKAPSRTCVVVTRYDEVAEYAEKRGIRVVLSKESIDGISFSIKNGLKAIKAKDEDRIMFVVADQPHLGADTIDRIFMASSGTAFETASAYCNGHPGNPVCFAGSLVEELMRLKGDEGGRKVTARHKCIAVEVDEAELKDIDENSQYSQIKRFT